MELGERLEAVYHAGGQQATVQILGQVIIPHTGIHGCLEIFNFCKPVVISQVFGFVLKIWDDLVSSLAVQVPGMHWSQGQWVTKQLVCIEINKHSPVVTDDVAVEWFIPAMDDCWQ